MTEPGRGVAGRASAALRAAFEPRDGAWLALLRVVYGVSMCVSMLRFIGYGWLDELLLEPTFHFKYWGFEWVEPLSRSSLHALAWALAGLAALVALGACFRVATLLFVVGFTYLQLIDVATYLNHYYLASLLGLLLFVSPAGRVGSLDALLLRRRERQQRPSVPEPATLVAAGWHYLFRFQVGVVYTFAGLAKANSDWLMHAQPLRIWLASNTDMPVLGAVFAQPWAPLAFSWGGFLFDTTVPWLLLIPRARPFAFAVVIAFHGLTRLLFPIGMFPFIMVLSALVFFSPSWPRVLFACVARLAGRARARVQSAPFVGSKALSKPGPLSFGQRALVGAAALYCAVQVAMPLRYLAYGDNVLWHEQGMRFSWRVMAREKNGSITFVVKSKRTGRTWHVSPRDYLTRLQERELNTQPDLILQLAHHVRDDFERRGKGPVEVRVDALVSLNGRGIARLIDADVDLASIEDGVAPKSWILPAPEEPPPHTRPAAVAARAGHAW